jgi:hypothetical protein
MSAETGSGICVRKGLQHNEELAICTSGLVRRDDGAGGADAAYLRYEITGVVTEVVMPGLTSVVG